MADIAFTPFQKITRLSREMIITDAFLNLIQDTFLKADFVMKRL